MHGLVPAQLVTVECCTHAPFELSQLSGAYEVRVSPLQLAVGVWAAHMLPAQGSPAHTSFVDAQPLVQVFLVGA